MSCDSESCEIFCCIVCCPCYCIKCCCCSEEMKKSSNKLYCEDCSTKKFMIYLIYLLIIFLAFFEFTFTYEKYDDDFNEIIYQIEKTLNSKLIYSFKNKTLCDLDEDELVLGTWDGTKVGCYCAGSIYNYECTEDLIKQECKTIPAHKKINYTMINSNYICVKKSTLSYRELLKTEQIIEKENNCPDNYKSCGIIDTLERKLCVKNSDSCPINKRMIEDNNNANDKYYFDAINILNEYEYLNNGEEGQILSIFTLNQKMPCIHPLEKSWDNHYILEKDSEKCETEINKQIFDNRYETLSKYKTKKYQLYLENSILDKLLYIDNIAINKLKNEEIYLFGRRLTGLDKNILDNFDYNRLISKENLSNQCNKFMVYCLIGFGGILAIMAVIIIIVQFGINKIGIKDFSLECDGLDKKKHGRVIKETLRIGLILAILLFFVFSILIFIIFDSYKSIENIINIKTSDDILSKIINEEFEKYDGNYIYSLLFIIFFSLMLIPFLISPCCCSEKDSYSYK